MAINRTLTNNDNNPLVSLCSSDSSKAGNSNRLVKIDFATRNCKSKQWKSKKYSDSCKSPYLCEDNYQLYSRTTERDLVYGNEHPEVLSSFSLAGKVYKANSDELTPVKLSQKKKKSVLTLPNKKVPLPQNYTVSDMNESEYCNQDNNRKAKTKKRNGATKSVCLRKKVEYDNSYFNVDIDSSSTILTKKYPKDKRSTKTKKNLRNEQRNSQNDQGFDTHDMWSVLKNINRFQFRPSPPASDDSNSIFYPRKKKLQRGSKKIAKSRKSTSYAETCRTEEFAYISSIEVDSRCPRSFSRSSSFDRITVINNEEDIETIFNVIQEKHKIPNAFQLNANINKSNQLKGKKQKIRRSKCKDPQSDSIENNSTINVIISSKSTSEESEPSIKRRSQKIVTDCDTSSIAKADKPIKQKEYSTINYEKNKNQFPILNQHNHVDLIGDSCRVHGNVFKKNNTSINRINRSKIPIKLLEITKTMEIDAGSIKQKPKIVIEKNIVTDVKGLANIEFPLIFIGKYQFTSAYWSTSWELPKVTWIENNNYINEDELIKIILRIESSKNMSSEISSKKKTTQKTKPRIEAPANTETMINNKAMKPNPIRQIRDTIMQFLHKRPSIQPCLADVKDVPSGNSSYVNNMQFSMSNSKEKPQNENKEFKVQSVNVRRFETKPPVARSPRNKGKWANDIVETVIKKIKNGIYYTRDSKEVKMANLETLKEVSVNDMVTFDNNENMENNEEDEDLNEGSPIVTVSKKLLPIKTIPGFDGEQPNVEVISLNTNKIEIKHFVTNITLQFDVLSSESVLQRKKVPKNVLEDFSSQASVFKCKTAISNPVLPAELCTVLPKMIHGLLSRIKPTTNCLLPLNKVTKPKQVVLPKFVCSEPIRPIIVSRQESFDTENGKFGSNVSKSNILNKSSSSKVYINEKSHSSVVLKNLLPILRNKLFFSVEIDTVHVIKMEIAKTQEIVSVKLPDITNTARRAEKCKDLVPYDPKSMWLEKPNKIINVDMNDFFRILGYLWNYFKTIESIIQCNEINTDIKDVVLKDPEQNKCKIHCNFTNILARNKLYYSPFEGYNRQMLNLNTINLKNIEYEETNAKSCNMYNSSKACLLKTKKSRRKHYTHSGSVLNTESETFTTKPLNEISDVEDFFDLLGTKSLSSVFSEPVAKKILQYLIEMENWTSEINSKQALLILLLVNKKETSNLMRFRNILLQGIAVQRITLACELDMEIEVIETENIEISQAADYQRPFDESLEKLLKSLLEKRKKLNPSYLRVMARYVGLGLLKLPRS